MMYNKAGQTVANEDSNHYGLGCTDPDLLGGCRAICLPSCEAPALVGTSFSPSDVRNWWSAERHRNIVGQTERRPEKSGICESPIVVPGRTFSAMNVDGKIRLV
jgi:hypothetical protein